LFTGIPHTKEAKRGSAIMRGRSNLLNLSQFSKASIQYVLITFSFWRSFKPRKALIYFLASPIREYDPLEQQLQFAPEDFYNHLKEYNHFLNQIGAMEEEYCKESMKNPTCYMTEQAEKIMEKQK
jgi:hypothetical protein